MKVLGCALSLPLLLSASVATAADDNAVLAQKAQAVLKTHCYRCHGQDGVVEGGMNYMLDLDKLVQRKKVTPGNPDKSPIYKKIVNNLMPPPDEQPRPSEAEVALLKQWIEAGAPRGAAQTAKRQLITETDVTRLMLADLDNIEPRARRFTRYFSLAHLYNAGLGEDELQTYRNALAKLVNSLSWHPRLTPPTAIDPAKTVFRIDLRQYMWDHNLWNRILVEYPYGVFQDTAAAKAVSVATATRMPVVRADWFLATASRAPLYYDLLQTPQQIAELERQLRVDVLLNIQQERVARAGFNGSGVSRNNRVLERHDSIHGAYWKTYDFNEVPQNLVDRQNLLPDKRNVFAYPLGPGGLDNHFQHAGGEVIYNLPNGLHAFVLINANGIRIDKAPQAVVSDPKRPDRAVEAGLSCMSCHVRGVNFKDDQVREYVEKNPKSFPRADRELIKALYVPRDKMRDLMSRDADQFKTAVEKTGAKVSTTETITTMVLRYEADLDLQTAAAEVGLEPEEFVKKLSESEVLSRNFGSLQVDGGTVARQVFVQAFGDLVKELRRGILFQSTQIGQSLPDNTGEIDPLEGRTSQANSMTFTTDGKFALFASADKTVILRDLDANRELRRFVGHTASVWSVAVSADGQFALSGGADNLVKLWEVGTGRELKTLRGHTALVTSVAFSSDGQRALTGSYDQTVILWDLKYGKELGRFEGPARFINCVTFLADDRRALIGGDKTLKLYDLTRGVEIASFDGHGDAVSCVALSADGKRFLTGGDDQTVQLWDLEKRQRLKLFKGHTGPIKTVALSPSGKWALSGSADGTLRLWDIASEKELGKFAKHADEVIAATFTADGGQTLSGSRDGDIRAWSLAKFANAKPYPEPKIVDDGPTVPVQGELKANGVVRVGATIGSLLLSPDGQSLHYLNASEGKAARIDAGRFQREQVLPLHPKTDVLFSSPDGKSLYALASANGRNQRPLAGVIQVVDPATLKLRKSFTVEADPFDGAATDAGVVYVSGGSGDWSDVAIIDVASEKLIGRFGGVWNRSFLKLSPAQDRLFFSSQGVSPATLDTLWLPGKNDEKPLQYRAPTVDRRPLGGDFLVSPDGKFLLHKTGTVLKLAAERDEDLQPVRLLEPFLSGVVNPDSKSLLLLTADGSLKHYSYPEFKLRGSYRLGIVGYQAALDGKTGQLYVAGFDPQELALRPGGKGLGDVYRLDVRAMIAGK
ncbi:MAG: WD40 repeat domain-containing protein [Planctomycetia bacterium]|nr:WD40 repeat domain-containing protein [Planctomycetia bacterium]